LQFAPHNSLVSDDIHVVVIIAFFFDHVVKLIVGNLSIFSHEDKQVDFFRILKIKSGIIPFSLFSNKRTSESLVLG
jgi:hypothetical protein